jgi:hypothetical protein
MQCPKCGGSGVLRQYGHVAGGVCFHCNGRGVVSGNGRKVKDILLKHIAAPLPGLTKRQTKEVFDLAWHNGIAWNCTEDSPDFAAIAAAGYWSREQEGRTIRYAPIDGLKLDWSHVRID